MRRIIFSALVGLTLLFVHHAHAQVNLSSGLVAYYPFNGTFNDASGAGNHGTPMNGASFGSDMWGNPNSAAFFDGIDDWINVGVPSFSFGKYFTIAFRYNPYSANHICLLARSNYSVLPTNTQFQVAFNHPTLTPKGIYLGTEQRGTCASPAGGFFSDYTISPAAVQTNQWYCIVMTFANGVKSIYINGVLAVQQSVTAAPNPTFVDSMCTGGTFRMGTWWQNDPRYYQGLLDEVRVYNRSLNQPEIDSLCNLVTAPQSETIINQYAAVTAKVPCSNSFTVDTATGFNIGDTVVMIQMKGATVDTSNTSSFGNILANNGAGNYEYNVVQAVSGNDITLRYAVQRNFNIPNGLVQLVRIPSYTTHTVSQKHTCLPWTGTKGGVFALRVAGTLTLNSPIDVTGKGFKGGKANTIIRTTQTCNETGFYHAPNMDTSAQKGEGIATVSFSKSYGRGKLANGGGGGNGHNSGGGGGSNGGSGGLGGLQYLGCTGGPASNIIAGVAGASLTYSIATNRAFLGGGGGAGHANNADLSNGGEGGGIVLINAGNIDGKGYSIIANGGDGPECAAAGSGCQDDGKGGGGGGGGLLITAGNMSSTNLFAKGGKGSNLFMSAPFINLPVGPGGGGGGGVIMVSTAIASSLITASVAGGNPGIMPQKGNITNGAIAGSTGVLLSGLNIPMPIITYVANAITVNFYDSTTAQCNTKSFINTSTTTTTGIRTWAWTFGDGGTSALQSPTHTYATLGTYSVKLVATDSNGCKDSIVKTVVVACPDLIINKYAAVLSKGTCNNIYTVDTASGFTSGDTILIIQMKGAAIDSSNSSSFGSVLSYNNTGFYEYNVVQTVIGNNITLRFNPTHNYDIPNGKVQFILTPSFTNLSTSSLQKHTCLPWTGTKGGVFAIRVAGTLTLNSDIDVSGKGFLGGRSGNSNLLPCNKTDYYYPAANNEGAQKGEGIVELSSARRYGRGAQANGGGGGNAANSGGGGGASYAAGGLGGNQSQIGPCATTLGIGGIGGTALTSSPFSRAFLGGGGGCGHGDDTAEKAGGNGGGIIFINATAIVGNNHVLKANGANAPECTGPGVIGGGCANDGGGGGGGGGLVYSTALSITGGLQVEAKGGKGSNVYFIGDPAPGPGGGGSGGAWAFIPGSFGFGVTFNGNGGAAGVIPQLANSNYGALAGSNGQSHSSSAMPMASVPFSGNVLTLAFSDSAVSCFGRKMINTTTSISSAPFTYSWFFPGGATSTQKSPTFTFPGYGSYFVTLTSVDSNGCSASLTKNVSIPYVHFAQGAGDTTMCTAQAVILKASGGNSYSWTPTTGLSTPTSSTTQANPTASTTYKVVVIDSVGCTDSDFVYIAITSTSNPVNANPADTNICTGGTVQLHATGVTKYQWTPAEGLNDPNSANPIAMVTSSVLYVVTGTDSAGCKSSDTVNIHALQLPELSATSEGVGSKCEDRPVLLKVTGNAVSYHWEPSRYVSNSYSVTTFAKPPTNTLFLVTGVGANGCTGTDTVTAFVSDESLVIMPDAFSPNGDNRNDVMHPMVFCDFSLDEYKIYDRWGNEVFSSNSLTRGWDGMRDGSPADVGTYHYILTGHQTSTNQKIQTKGTFILLR